MLERLVEWIGYKIYFFILELIARLAVPVFFFFNGYYFYSEYKKNGDKYYKQFCIKILKLHIAAGLIYKGYFSLMQYKESGKFTMEYFNLKKLFSEFIYYGFYNHLWYLPAVILGVTLLLIFIKLDKVKLGFYISILLYSAGVICNILNNNGIIKMGYTRNGLFVGMLFIIMGYLYNENHGKINKFFIFNTPWVFLLLLLERMAVYKWIGTKENEIYISLIPATYFLADYALKNKRAGNNFISKLGEKSVGIYLYHWLILAIMWRVCYYLKLTNKDFTFNIVVLVFSYLGLYYFYIVLDWISKKIKYYFKTIKQK